MDKYAAMLLFQYRIEHSKNKRRICEEIIINFYANSPNEALDFASKEGIARQMSFNVGKRHVYFEFVGVIDIIELTVDDDEKIQEVWSRFIEKVLPMERRTYIIPSKEKFSIFKSNRYKIKL